MFAEEKMKALLSAIALLVPLDQGGARELAADAKPDAAEVERSPVEKELLRAIGKAWEHDYPGALTIVRPLYGRADVDQELILRCETAIRVSQAANRLDAWEGSDFGKATPWFGGVETLWMDWERQEDGSLLGTPRGDISISYFDMIIRHSLKEIEASQHSRRKGTIQTPGSRAQCN